jgi:hypothetical protein
VCSTAKRRWRRDKFKENEGEERERENLKVKTWEMPFVHNKIKRNALFGCGG